MADLCNHRTTNPLSRRRHVSKFNFVSLIYSESLGTRTESSAVSVRDEQPDLLPLRLPCSPTPSRGKSLARSAPAHPVCLTAAPSTSASPTRRSCWLTRLCPEHSQAPWHCQSLHWPISPNRPEPIPFTYVLGHLCSASLTSCGLPLQLFGTQNYVYSLFFI